MYMYFSTFFDLDTMYTLFYRSKVSIPTKRRRQNTTGLGKVPQAAGRRTGACPHAAARSRRGSPRGASAAAPPGAGEGRSRPPRAPSPVERTKLMTDLTHSFSDVRTLF